MESRVGGCTQVFPCCGGDQGAPGCERVCRRCGGAWGQRGDRCYNKAHNTVTKTQR